MSARTIELTPALHAYWLEHTVQEPELLRRLREDTAQLPNANMQICPEQGQLMRVLIGLCDVRRAIEVGVFTGYSSLCAAMAMPADGRLIACDVHAEWTAIARRYWKEAAVDEKIDLRLAPAQQTLDGLIAAGAEGSFDYMFIDADKAGYDGYYERGLRLLRTGGLLAIDNALWSGKVADPSVDDDDTRALRALNRKISLDARVAATLVPIGDGLWLARKR